MPGVCPGGGGGGMGGFGIDRYISVEHFAIASAGFFVLLASSPFRERNNFIRLHLKKNIKLYCIYRCFNTQNYIFFKISASALFLKFRKFQPQYSYKKYSH